MMHLGRLSLLPLSVAVVPLTFSLLPLCSVFGVFLLPAASALPLDGGELMLPQLQRAQSHLHHLQLQLLPTALRLLFLLFLLLLLRFHSSSPPTPLSSPLSSPFS